MPTLQAFGKCLLEHHVAKMTVGILASNSHNECIVNSDKKTNLTSHFVLDNYNCAKPTNYDGTFLPPNNNNNINDSHQHS